MHIRPAARHDVAAIVALLADDVLGAQREANTDPLPDAYFDAFERIDADPNQELVVLEHDGEVVGTLQLTFIPYLTHRGGTRAQIEAVRIAGDHRGEGLGETCSAGPSAEQPSGAPTSSSSRRTSSAATHCASTRDWASWLRTRG